MTLRSILAAVAILLVSLSSSVAGEYSLKVFWASDPVKPGEVVQVIGSGLSAINQVDVVALQDRAGEPGRGRSSKADILSVSESALSFILPKDMGSKAYSVTLRSRTSEVSFPLNTPDIYWVQGDLGTDATPGGWLRLSGRNIAVSDSAVIRAVGSDGHETILPVQQVDDWSATFPIPAELPAGTYQMSLWNGSGDSSSWTKPRPVVIVERRATHGPVETLARASSSADGPSDTQRINAALTSLGQRGGGTLVLNAGSYRLTDTLVIPDGVTLKGASSASVALNWADSDNPPDPLVRGVRDFAIEDLTINARRHFNIVEGGFDPVSQRPIGENIAVRRVIIRASSFMGHLRGDWPRRRLAKMQNRAPGGVTGLRLAGRNIVIEGCDVLTSMRPFVLIRPTNARLSENIFHVGRLGWYSISGPDGVLFENNRIIGTDLQATGGGINTFGGSPFARNVLFRNNEFETIFGWDREAMTTDGPGGYYHGSVTAISDRSIRLDEATLGDLQDGNWSGAGLFVVKGPGLGFVARIIARQGNTLDLDQNISGLVDGRSRVSIVPMQENFLIVDNKFEDTGSAQVFGTGYNHIFAGNTFLRSSPLRASSLKYRQLQPNFRIQFTGNRFTSRSLSGPSGIRITSSQKGANPVVLSLGIVVRNNRLNSGAAIRVDGNSSGAPGIQDLLVEGNTIADNDIGISIGRGVAGVILRGNRTHDVRIPVKR